MDASIRNYAGTFFHIQFIFLFSLQYNAFLLLNDNTLLCLLAYVPTKRRKKNAILICLASIGQKTAL